MLFAIRFTDRADKQAVRHEYLPAHIEWLAQRRNTILVAGSLRNRPQENPVGALWVVDVESEDELVGLYDSDPFWQQGLRESVEILHWSKAFPDQQVPV